MVKQIYILLIFSGLNALIPDGNMLGIKDKNFGMGKDHPVAWYRTTGKGRTFYPSIGHDATAWEQEPFIRMLEKCSEGS